MCVSECSGNLGEEKEGERGTESITKEWHVKGDLNTILYYFLTNQRLKMSLEKVNLYFSSVF